MTLGDVDAPEINCAKSGHGTDIVAGTGITFEPRGEHELKGIPGPRRLFAVVSV